jgi:hypothetical protein
VHAARDLEGSARTMGALRLADRCLQVEGLARRDEVERAADVVVDAEADFADAAQALEEAGAHGWGAG